MDVKVWKKGDEQYSEGQRDEQMDGELKKWGDGVMDNRMGEGQKCASMEEWMMIR